MGGLPLLGPAQPPQQPRDPRPGRRVRGLDQQQPPHPGGAPAEAERGGALGTRYWPWLLKIKEEGHSTASATGNNISLY